MGMNNYVFVEDGQGPRRGRWPLWKIILWILAGLVVLGALLDGPPSRTKTPYGAHIEGKLL